MARPIRILFKGAYYHVINRGHRKAAIYLEDRDYQKFLQILKEACKIYNASIAAYCLMANHYHLLVHTPEANLPDFMRQINGVYTQIFNKKYKFEGALFKGRYKAMVVQEGSYLLRLVRYIHQNPLKAGIVKEIKGKDFKQEYINFMKKDDEEISNYLQDKSAQAVKGIIFGDQKYIDAVKEQYLNAERYYEEIPESRQIRAELVIRKIKEGTIKVFKINEEQLYRTKKGKENVARMIAIRLARECSMMPHRQIGQLFGGISYKSSSIYCERIKKRCVKDKKLANVYERLKARCSQVET